MTTQKTTLNAFSLDVHIELKITRLLGKNENIGHSVGEVVLYTKT